MLTYDIPLRYGVVLSIYRRMGREQRALERHRYLLVMAMDESLGKHQAWQETYALLTIARVVELEEDI
jgi:hypothetical protein